MANTHALASLHRSQQAWFGDRLLTGYIISGGLPAVPTSSLTVDAFATEGYVLDGAEMVYVNQGATTITIADSTPTWLAIHRSRNETVSGWTRQSATHYLYQQSASKPAEPAGGHIFAKVTVAASVISAITDASVRVIAETLTLPNNTVVDDTGAWLFGPRGDVDLNTKTLDFNGFSILDASPYRQIFTNFANGDVGFELPREVFPTWWGAKDSVNSRAAIQEAHDALPSRGGTITLVGGTYNIDSSSINFSKPIHFRGTAGAGDDAPTTSATRLLKPSGSTHNGLTFTTGSARSRMSNIHVDGTGTQSAGDGIIIRANSVSLDYVSVTNQGNDGIRIGDDSAGFNANQWMLVKCSVNNNGQHGLHLHDNTPDANNGTAINLVSANNTSYQLFVNKAFHNVFINLLTETGTNKTILKADSSNTIFLGGTPDITDMESTAGFPLFLGANLEAITDSGATKPIILGGAQNTQQISRGLGRNRTQFTQSGGGTLTHSAFDSDHVEVNVTDSTAFTIAAPTNTTSIGQTLTYRIRNSSGGALGTITWNAIFKLAAWASPTNGNSHSITYFYDGTNWIEISRTGTEVPN